VKLTDEVIDEIISHYKYREDYTKKTGTDPDYEYENGFINALLWVLNKYGS